MAIGIYSLYWEKQDLIYIGQSQNIEARFKKHLRDLNNKEHSNYKVQNAFDNYGIPSLNILEICTLHNLNELEIVWQKEFDSLNSLDLIDAGNRYQGLSSTNSKYTKLQVLKTFRLLYTNKISYSTIANLLSVNIGLVADISSGRTHIWLKYKYPCLYLRMLKRKPISNKNIINNKNSMFSSSGREITLIKNNVKYIITNQSVFAKEHNIDPSNISKLIRGKLLSCRGFTLEK